MAWVAPVVAAVASIASAAASSSSQAAAAKKRTMADQAASLAGGGGTGFTPSANDVKPIPEGASYRSLMAFDKPLMDRPPEDKGGQYGGEGATAPPMKSYNELVGQASVPAAGSPPPPDPKFMEPPQTVSAQPAPSDSGMGASDYTALAGDALSAYMATRRPPPSALPIYHPQNQPYVPTAQRYLDMLRQRGGGF